MSSPKGHPPALAPKRPARRGWRSKFWALVALLAAAGAGVWIWAAARGEENNADTPLFRVARGEMLVSILEGGSVKAVRSTTVQCEVEGQRRIISIVPEGSTITPEDVKAKKILVELDSTDLQERVSQDESNYQSAQAQLTQAQESYAIRKNQNESDIKKGELNAKFARMDLDKYVGAKLAESSLELFKGGSLKFDSVASNPDLGGEALQTLRKKRSEIDFAVEEAKRAKDRLAWTQRLYEAKQVSKEDLQADELSAKRKENAVREAELDRDLFVQYDMPKKLEKLLADLTEQERELERIKARARSELAKEEANLLSRQASFAWNSRRLEKSREQLENCVIRATKPGLVVYASSIGNRWGRSDPIEEGAMIRQRQEIISLPDVSEMAVTIKVHESFADKVKVGQRALITVDAFPDQTLEGEVSKVAVLPDSSSRWLNPDLKVYMTDVAIKGDHSKDLKPGMSAKVEVIVADLKDVLYVPIQAIVPQGEGRACYVMGPNGPEQRTVETGLFNDRFIEVKKGLEEGEEVLLNPPGAPARGSMMARKRPAKRKEEEEREKAEAAAERRAAAAESQNGAKDAAPAKAEGAEAGGGAKTEGASPGGGETGRRRGSEGRPGEPRPRRNGPPR